MGVRFYPVRVFTAPAARPLAAAPGRTLVALDGLVCGWCATRTQRAFAALPGVRAATVDLASGLASIEHEFEASPSAAAFEQALARVVIAGRARRLLARLTTLARRALAVAP